jgi:hypothetical protein
MPLVVAAPFTSIVLPACIAGPVLNTLGWPLKHPGMAASYRFGGDHHRRRHRVPMAYCLPSPRRPIVISTGAQDRTWLG